jgi:hypothetical protein
MTFFDIFFSSFLFVLALSERPNWNEVKHANPSDEGVKYETKKKINWTLQNMIKLTK